MWRAHSINRPLLCTIPHHRSYRFRSGEPRHYLCWALGSAYSDCELSYPWVLRNPNYQTLYQGWGKGCVGYSSCRIWSVYVAAWNVGAPGMARWVGWSKWKSVCACFACWAVGRSLPLWRVLPSGALDPGAVGSLGQQGAFLQWKSLGWGWVSSSTAGPPISLAPSPKLRA